MLMGVNNWFKNNNQLKDKVKELESKIDVLESRLASCMRRKGVGCRVCNRNDGTCGCSGVSDSCCEI